jgi:hypothetical protein
MTAGLSFPRRIALNASDDVIVMNGATDTYDYPSIYTAASHYAGNPIEIKLQLSDAVDMRVSPQGTIVVASCGTSCGHSADDEIVQFTAPYSATETPTFMNTVDPMSLTIDPKGNLWVGECEHCTVQASGVAEHLPTPGETNVYQSAVTNLIDETNQLDGASALAVDAAGHVFVAGASDGNYPGLREYTAPYTGTPTGLFGQDISSPEMNVDAAGDLFMMQDITYVIVASPPYSSYTTVVQDYGSPPVFGQATHFALAP